jgi:hypothetical protein
MGTIFKIIGKLGAKCRHYKDDKPVRSVVSEDGLVLYFTDKHSGKTIKLGMDFVLQTTT